MVFLLRVWGVGEQLFPLKAALGHKRVQQTNNHAAFLRTDLLSICAANICWLIRPSCWSNAISLAQLRCVCSFPLICGCCQNKRCAWIGHYVPFTHLIYSACALPSTAVQHPKDVAAKLAHFCWLLGIEEEVRPRWRGPTWAHRRCSCQPSWPPHPPKLYAPPPPPSQPSCNENWQELRIVLV